jgi:hypothetical protein
MDNEQNKDLNEWVTEYYKSIIKSSKVNGVYFSYYQSLRGYFKHSILLTDIKQQEFGLVDYRVWDTLLTKIKSGRNPSESGGLYFRHNDYEDICSSRSWFRTRKKFLEFKLLLPTPFKDYYLLNPRFVIKMYNPKDDGIETPE